MNVLRCRRDKPQSQHSGIPADNSGMMSLAFKLLTKSWLNIGPALWALALCNLNVYPSSLKMQLLGMACILLTIWASPAWICVSLSTTQYVKGAKIISIRQNGGSSFLNLSIWNTSKRLIKSIETRFGARVQRRLCRFLWNAAIPKSAASIFSQKCCEILVIPIIGVQRQTVTAVSFCCLSLLHLCCLPLRGRIRYCDKMMFIHLKRTRLFHVWLIKLSLLPQHVSMPSGYETYCWHTGDLFPANTKHCITFIQRRPNVEDVVPTLYKCYTNVLCLMGCLLTVTGYLFITGSGTAVLSWLWFVITLVLRSQVTHR